MTTGSAIDQVKSWAAPVLLVAVIGMGTMIWNRSESRDDANDVVVSAIAKDLAAVAQSVAVMQQNQADNTESRIEFQGAMTNSVDKLNDAILKLSESVAAQGALQGRQPN